ncbi:MAG: hypothetical protein AAGE52_27590, partial [Myxococcota bacterium]
GRSLRGGDASIMRWVHGRGPFSRCGIALAFLVCGCGRSSLDISAPDASPRVDARGPDAGVDASEDAGPIDGALDAGFDATVDAELDSGVDSAIDGGCIDDLALEYRWDYLSAGVVPIGNFVVADVFPGGPPEIVTAVNIRDLGHTGIHVFNVDDDRTLTIDTHREMTMEWLSWPIAADVDNDGETEIIVIGSSRNPRVAGRRRRRLAAYGPDGTLEWTFQAPEWTWGIYGSVSIADLEDDGDVELVIGSTVVDGATGTLVWQGAADTSQGIGVQTYYGPHSCVGDLDGDGRQEVVAGNSVYEWDGRVRWHQPDFEDGFCGIADLIPEEPGAEVVLTTDGRARILRSTDGELLWVEPFEGWGRPPFGSAPTIIDFNGDGALDVVVAGNLQTTVFDLGCGDCDPEGILRHYTHQNALGGVTAFDFNFDGAAEILLADPSGLRILDASGERFDTGRYQDLEHSYFGVPMVVDIDADGEAEILARRRRPGFGHGVNFDVLTHREHGWPGAESQRAHYAHRTGELGERGRPATTELMPTLRETRAFARPGMGNCIEW